MNKFLQLPATFYDSVSSRSNSVLLETARFDEENFRSYLFLDPVEVLKAFSIEDLPSLFRQIEVAQRDGFFLAGFFAYECGYHFEPIIPKVKTKMLLAWLGIYERPLIYDHSSGGLESNSDIVMRNLEKDPTEQVGHQIEDVQFLFGDCSPIQMHSQYLSRIASAKNHIYEGDIYQLNFTGKCRFRFTGSLISLYKDLNRKQRTSYSAFINTDSRTILSFSPELFFRREGKNITARPMKGTVHRGKTLDEDATLHDWLRNDGKNRAENVMIVDLVRNDLGRIAEIGSVRTSSLFDIEKYETLFQMTSTIHAQLRNDVQYYDIFRALFPCGSVTGAPKIRAMQIIHLLEGQPRGVYTGAIGYISPHQEAVFNVAIRTVVRDGENGEMGIGSGIVWDSNPNSEYEECILKSQFLTQPHEEFKLIETILWWNGYPFLANHLKRLRESAKYFDFPMFEDIIVHQLNKLAAGFLTNTKYKVRLVLDHQGDTLFETSIIEEATEVGRAIVAVSLARTDSRDRFLYHKTTHRSLYDERYSKALQMGCVDVLFMNEQDEITEGAISNIFVERDNTLVTPPVRCGLLNGVYRQHVLCTHPTAREEILHFEDVIEADAIYVCNAIRGIRKVRLRDGLI